MIMKKYIIAMLSVGAVLTSSAGYAQKTMATGCPIVATHHHYKHHVKRAPVVAHDETIDINNPTSTGTVEFRKGDLYINGRFVAKVANPKQDDYKVVLNYTAPVAIVENTDNSYTGNMAEKPIIENILPGGPADKAGLDRGDVITKLDGREIGNSEDLVEAINKHGAGENVSLTYTHGSRTETTDAKLTKATSVSNCSNNGQKSGGECGCRHARHHDEW
jgi:membrane-associated protease RseP (regulator of RpoE activity)